MSTPPLRPLAVHTRLLCAAGSIALTGVLVGTLLGLFGRAGPAEWLSLTPELLALLAPCQRLTGRTERLQCQRMAVLAARAGAPQMAAAP